tara:strand:- start:18263 stop:18496 length:234 start_codon:yes stop_codon:yes gene_type:complete
MTNKQKIQKIKLITKSNGLIFKRENANQNGAYRWQLKDRATGKSLINNYKLLSAWSDCMTGYISSYNAENKTFEMTR